jgi:hypothetical protein
MPFATLPGSPSGIAAVLGTPDWGRFAELAIQGIYKGAELRQQAQKDFLSSLDKSFEQTSKIMEYNSPLSKTKRKMEMMKDQYLYGIYEDAQAHPEKYIMTAQGPKLRDPFEEASKIIHFKNSVLSYDTGTENLAEARRKRVRQEDLNNGLDTFRARQRGIDWNSVPLKPAGASTSVTQEPASGAAAPDSGSTDSSSTDSSTAQPASTPEPESTPLPMPPAETDQYGRPVYDIYGQKIDYDKEQGN